MRTYHPFTPNELSIVRDLYPNMPTARLAEMLGRNVQSIYNAADRLSVKKSAEYLASPDAYRWRRGKTGGEAYRFKPGHATWNKGMKGLQIGGKETQFKRGSRNGRALEIYKPIGFERISKDGYLQRKVNDDMPLQRRWKFVHVIIWEQAHGPVPHGHMVTFKNRDKTDLRLDNFELITRAEMMRRNTYHRYPKEIALAVQLRGALQRHINKLERETA